VVGGVKLIREVGGAGGLRLTTIGLISLSVVVVGEGAVVVTEFSIVDGELAITLTLGLRGGLGLGGGSDHTGGGGLISIFGLEGAGVGSLNMVGFCVGFLVGLSVTFMISITFSKLNLRASFFVICRLEHLFSWQSRTKTLLTVSKNG